jgi:hypothetical protein
VFWISLDKPLPRSRFAYDNMASDSIDTLDEFFDFAQLEHDNGMHGASVEHEFDIRDFAAHDGMDWQPTGLVSDGSCAGLPSGVYTDNSLMPNLDLIPSNDHTGPATGIPTEAYLALGDSESSPQPQGSSYYGSHSTEPTTVDSTLPTIDHVDIRVDHPTPSSQPQRSASVHKPASATRKGPSARIPVEARQMLEEEFATNPYPCSWEMDIIAHQANLDVKRVRNWYNNTRARKKHTSQSCIFPTL